MSTSNYIYNKTISYIKKGHNPDFNNLRDLIITEGTKILMIYIKSYMKVKKNIK